MKILLKHDSRLCVYNTWHIKHKTDIPKKQKDAFCLQQFDTSDVSLISISLIYSSIRDYHTLRKYTKFKLNTLANASLTFHHQ